MDIIKYDLKSAGKPSITINQEDANYYGYRTKVATRMNYGTIQLVFYEDALNRANNLLWNYLNAISPISTLVTPPSSKHVIGESDIKSQQGSIGPLPNDARDGIFTFMKIYHHYPAGDHHGVTTYNCHNPKIESASYTELDMSSNEAATVTITFTIDGCTITHSNNSNIDNSGFSEPYTTINDGANLGNIG